MIHKPAVVGKRQTDRLGEEKTGIGDRFRLTAVPEPDAAVRVCIHRASGREISLALRIGGCAQSIAAQVSFRVRFPGGPRAVL